jgi:hypothetical protein
MKTMQEEVLKDENEGIEFQKQLARVTVNVNFKWSSACFEYIFCPCYFVDLFVNQFTTSKHLRPLFNKVLG